MPAAILFTQELGLCCCWLLTDWWHLTCCPPLPTATTCVSWLLRPASQSKLPACLHDILMHKFSGVERWRQKDSTNNNMSCIIYMFGFYLFACLLGLLPMVNAGLGFDYFHAPQDMPQFQPGWMEPGLWRPKWIMERTFVVNCLLSFLINLEFPASIFCLHTLTLTTFFYAIRRTIFVSSRNYLLPIWFCKLF